MPVVGLVVEGEYDEYALKAFLLKHFNEHATFEVRVCGGPIKKIWLGVLEEFRLRVEKGQRLDRAVVAMDSDETTPESVLTALQAKKASKPPYPFPVILGLAVRELEAWLLADEQALSKVLRTPVACVSGNIQKLKNPKEVLAYLLIMNGVVYTKEVAAQIASAASLSTVQERCSWFRRLLADLGSPT